MRLVSPKGKDSAGTTTYSETAEPASAAIRGRRMRAGSFLSEDATSLPATNPTGIGRTAAAALRDWASAAPPKQRAASPAEPRTKKSLLRTPSLEPFISRLLTYL